VPKPTSKPPKTSSGHDASNVIPSDQSKLARCTSAPPIKPPRNSTRHAISPRGKNTSPPEMPLMPATRPLASYSTAVTMPIAAPPIKADTGVKFSMSLGPLVRLAA